jgi:hypothetical protein
MLKLRTISSGAIVGLIMAAMLCPTAFASYAIPPENISSGVVQEINYASNTVTVNGHVYKISPKAAYVSDNVRNIGGLQTGMRIQFIANGPVSKQSSQIINIVVLPPTPQ